MQNGECRIERRDRLSAFPPFSFCIHHSAFCGSSKRNIVVVEGFAAGPRQMGLARLAVIALAPVQHARALVGLVVTPLLVLALAAGLFHPVGLRRALTGLQAVLPLLALDVVVAARLPERLVQLPVLGLRRVPLGVGAVLRVEPLLVLIAVVVAPAFVGGVLGVGGENVEGEAGPVAVGRRAHPEPVEPHRVADDPLEPDPVAHEDPAAVQAVALARLLGRGEAVLPSALVVGVPRVGGVLFFIVLDVQFFAPRQLNPVVFVLFAGLGAPLPAVGTRAFG